MSVLKSDTLNLSELKDFFLKLRCGSLRTKLVPKRNFHCIGDYVVFYRVPYQTEIFFRLGGDLVSI